MLKYILILITAVLIAGCGTTGGSDSPENALKDFITAIKEKNYNNAWEQLNKSSHKYFDSKAKGRNMSGRELMEKTLPNLPSLGILSEDFMIADKKQEEDVVMIKIKTNDGRTSEIYTEKEGEIWKLDFEKSIIESIIHEEN
jgi:hypothetical protein